MSSTYNDLIDHRRIVIEGLERMDLESGRMEIFGARPRTALEASLDEVAKSDLFVGIYAHRYGSMPDGFVSITEREYDRAVELKKPVLAFIVDDAFHWDEALKENDPGRSRLAALKARIRNEQTPGFCPQAVRPDATPETFTSPEILGFRVATSVARELRVIEVRRIPAPAPDAPVSLANIALLHTTWFSPKDTARRADGMRYYRFDVVVMAPRAVMQRITSVIWRTSDVWPEQYRVRLSQDRADRFRMKELANGTSIVRAEINIDGQQEPLRLNRFIDLREEGPHL